MPYLFHSCADGNKECLTSFAGVTRVLLALAGGVGESGRVPSPTWPEIASSRGLGLWLDRTALAVEVTPEVLAAAAATAGESVPPRGWGGVIDRLAASGLGAPGASAGTTLRLDPAVQDAMVAELERLPGGVDAVRAGLVRAGVSAGLTGLAGQLAVWAREASDWEALERVWLRFPPRSLFTSPLAERALGDLPEGVRAERPVLGQAAAFCASAGHGGVDAELDAKVRCVIADGWAFHGQWRRRGTVDDAVAAGAMRLFAEMSMAGSLRDPGLDVAWATALDVEDLLVRSIREATPPSPLVASFFHSAASSTAVLRRDWDEAKRHAQLGMHWSPECDVSGFISALALAITGLMVGSPKEYRRAMRFVEEHGDHRCPAAEWVLPMAALPRLLQDQRFLHRGDPAVLRWDGPGASPVLRRFGYAPMQLWVGSFWSILWSQPERALAEFDAGVAAADDAGMLRGGWGPLILRARVELLLSLGAVNRARRGLADLEEQEPLLALVPKARLNLLARDVDAAAAVADEGLYSLRVPLHERAHLEVVKAAARLLGEADARTVDALVEAACLVCQEANSLLPFAMLPADLRSRLLDHHDPGHLGGGCLLAGAVADGAFDALVDKRWWGNFPVHLTPREQALLHRLAEGLSLAEIAAADFVSVNTLRKQEAELRRKLDVHGRNDLLSRAFEVGLLAASDLRHER